MLKASLEVMRHALKTFENDKGLCPDSLDELVPNYLRKVPVDSVTNSSDSWVYSDCAVRSGAPGDDLDGVPYASY